MQNRARAWRSSTIMMGSSELHSQQQRSSFRFSQSKNSSCTCKLCFRKFASSRALGGHMRFHVMSSSKAEKLSPPPPPLRSSYSSSSTEKDRPENPTSAAVEDSSLGYSLRAKPKRNSRFVDPNFIGYPSLLDNSSALVLDGESENDESCRRNLTAGAGASSRHRDRSPQDVAKTEARSCSFTETLTDDEAALCLFVLSRDSWTTTQQEKDVVGKETVGQPEPEPFDEENKFFSFGGSKKPSEKMDKYKRTPCNKVFPTYQALRGHRNNHKQLKPLSGAVAASRRLAKEPVIGQNGKHPKVHQCFICFREFGSNQALGGHMRAHAVNAVAASGDNRRLAKEPVIRQNGKVPRLHQCSICFREFGSSQAMGGHMRVHAMYDNCYPPATERRTTQPDNAVMLEGSSIDHSLPVTMEVGDNDGMVEDQALVLPELNKQY